MSTEEFTRLMEEHEAIVAEEKSRDRTDLQEDVLRAAVALHRARVAFIKAPKQDFRPSLRKAEKEHDIAVDALLAAEPAWGEGK